MKRGGKRKGAGRPAKYGERKQTTAMRLTPTLLRYFAQHELTAGELVERTFRRQKAFKDWAENE